MSCGRLRFYGFPSPGVVRVAGGTAGGTGESEAESVPLTEPLALDPEFEPSAVPPD